MDADFATQSSPPTAASVAVLLSGTMRGFREGCIASLREHVVQPNAQHGVAIYLATYTESDCGKKVRSMRREGALTGVSLRDGVTVLPIKSLRASDINATYLRYTLPRAVTLSPDKPMALSLAPTRKGVSLAALRIGPFRAAEVRVPQHRLRNQDSMPAGALDRYHSQFRLRQLAVDLAVPNNPSTDPI